MPVLQKPEVERWQEVSTSPIRVYDADKDRIDEDCARLDRTTAEWVHDAIERIDQLTKQVRYLEYDRAQIIKQRNELQRIVKSGA